MLDSVAMLKLLPEHRFKVIEKLNLQKIRHEIKNEILFIYADYAEQLIEIGMFIQKIRTDGTVRNTG